ncbi:hypothetical protein CA54_54030 [Symmachiella macrocystis]|uniref:Uncharacterized protein n=1 Tax=Symmachiella macrocystis TaxID=2527985 RepID=A0A5C6B6P0_9PLAN|nr:hypothetical protein CA54_54030 [Symmachiella macrocystis]
MNNLKSLTSSCCQLLTWYVSRVVAIDKVTTMLNASLPTPT